jgi:hypothetical protein
MPLSWNEIRDRATQFAHEWADESREDAEAKTFLDQFFNIFGITRKRIASFEHPVKKLDGKSGYIDLLWKGKLIVEMKSRGGNTESVFKRAFKQATDYFPGLKESELPRYILVCNFERFHLTDLETDEDHEFALADLAKSAKYFGFIAGYETHTYKEQDPVNIQAAELMGKLHDGLKEIGYTGHDLEVLLVRLLFCLFADDTGIFVPSGIFQEYIEGRTSEDGSDLGSKLDELFQVLNKPEEKRLKSLDEQLAAFPYVNGKLFEERLETSGFTGKMRKQLLEAGKLNWSAISPAIFGALFQSIMDPTARRNLGGHYTSEKNILKLIKPLFLDELWSEFEKVKKNPARLREFHSKLRSLKFLDPACGCGNFLVITYRELRLLELDVLRALAKSGQLLLDVHTLIQLDVDQFYGIEIEEFPAQIAQVALWLVDHQMNTKVGEEFGQWFARIPLKTPAHIVNGNALRMDWNEVVPKEELSFILGNPPFVGKQYQNAEQKKDSKRLQIGIQGGGVLDYVTNWYFKSARYMRGNPLIACAFVSTNSITQGEQVSILWGELLKQGFSIFFAHRTFRWRNEAKGVAGVHCVIVGFSLAQRVKKTLFFYDDIGGEPRALSATSINPYLVDAANIVLTRKGQQITNAPEIRYGSKPADGGAFILDEEERLELLKREPEASKFIRPLIGAEELINNSRRWCLWLAEAEPSVLRKMPLVLERVDQVRSFRMKSKKKPTVEMASTPTLFAENRQPSSNFLAIPEVSSENRIYIPIAYLSRDVVPTNKLYTLEKATLFQFGVIQSLMHMAWTRQVAGRLESRYHIQRVSFTTTSPGRKKRRRNRKRRSKRRRRRCWTRGRSIPIRRWPISTIRTRCRPRC